MSKKLGERLIAAGLVSRDAVEQGLDQQRLTGHRLGYSLVEMGLLAEATLLRFLASEFNTRYVSAEKLARAQVPTELLDRVPVRMAEANGLLPLAVDDERRILSIVAAEPQNEDVLREIAAVADVDEVYAYVALRSVVHAGIQKHYYGDTTAFSSLPTGARGPNRADLSSIAAAYESSGSSRTAPPLPSGSGEDQPARRRRPAAGPPKRAGWSVAGGGRRGDYVETVRVLVEQLERSAARYGDTGAAVATGGPGGAADGAALPEVASVAVAALIHDLGKGGTHSPLAGTPAIRAEGRGPKVTMAPLQMFEAVHFPAQVGATLAQITRAWDGSGTQGAKGEASPSARASSPQSTAGWTSPGIPRRLRTALHPRAGAQLPGEQAAALRPGWWRCWSWSTPAAARRRLESDGRQILVADPDPVRRDMVVHALGKRGWWSTRQLGGGPWRWRPGDLWVFSVGVGEEELVEAAVQLRSDARLAGTRCWWREIWKRRRGALHQSGVSSSSRRPRPARSPPGADRAGKADLRGAPARVVQGAADG
jgi:hypothetical protein